MGDKTKHLSEDTYDALYCRLEIVKVMLPNLGAKLHLESGVSPHLKVWTRGNRQGTKHSSRILVGHIGIQIRDNNFIHSLTRRLKIFETINKTKLLHAS